MLSRVASRAAGRSLRAAARRALAASSQVKPVSEIDPAFRSQRVPLSRTPSNEDRVTTMLVVIGDRPGALEEILAQFKEHHVNMTFIQSRPSKSSTFNVDIEISFEGSVDDANVSNLLLSANRIAHEVVVVDPKHVPWFPRHLAELDLFSTKTLDAGADLESDHPGFHDVDYRDRRARIVENGRAYRYGDELPSVEYSTEEVETWGMVYDRLTALYPKYACKQFRHILPMLERHCGYSRNNIPQLADISRFLCDSTGFRLRPVSGLLTARDFLNGLAFRTFFSTQYIRHHSKPLYTPEPDIVHELMGHAPMFADADFADFSHEIGLASLGASDADIKRLATCYWFSVEFGLCKEEDGVKAYGAGLLSSFGELEYACSPTRPAGGTDEMPQLLPWQPSNAAGMEYPITTYQPRYFVAESLADAKDKMRDFCETLARPFRARYISSSQSVRLDRPVVRDPPVQDEAEA